MSPHVSPHVSPCLIDGQHAIKGTTVIKFRDNETKVCDYHGDYSDREILLIVEDLGEFFKDFRDDFMSTVDQAHAFSQG